MSHVVYMNIFLYQRNYSTCYILTQDEEWDVCSVRHRALSSNATEERCHFRIRKSVGWVIVRHCSASSNSILSLEVARILTGDRRNAVSIPLNRN